MLVGPGLSGYQPSSEVQRRRVSAACAAGRERDDPDNHVVAARLESGIPAAEKVTVSGAGHMLNLEKPEEFNRRLARFLRKGCAG